MIWAWWPGWPKRVNVMYAGYIVESGPIRSVFKTAAHPYTIGLLGSLPGRDISSDQDLLFIEGSPPDMIRLPQGCPFEPRCAYRTDPCAVKNPLLEQVGPDHRAACWNLEQVSASRKRESASKVTRSQQP